MSQIIREMQVKTTMRYHLAPVRRPTTNKSASYKCGQGFGKGEPVCTVGGLSIAGHYGNSTEVPRKC